MSPMQFKVFYQNVNSIRGRLDAIRLGIGLIQDLDIIILTETFLNEDIDSAELGLFNYNVFRCDRSILTSDKKDGGGVLIALHKKFQFEKYQLATIVMN